MPLPHIACYELPDLAGIGETRIRWRPDPRRAVLLIHDLQEHFLQPYEGGWVREVVVRNVARLRQACKSAGIPVIYTAQSPDQTLAERGLLQTVWGDGLRNRPEYASIVEDVTPDADDVVLDKWRYSAFAKTDLETRLKHTQRDELYICGVYAHIGCLATAMDAFMRDIRPFIIRDAVADFSLEEHTLALRHVGNICGGLSSTAELCFLIERESRIVERVVTVLAEVLNRNQDQIALDDDLREIGLDSVRLMMLVEYLPLEGAPDVASLVACRSVRDLCSALVEVIDG